MLRWALFLLMSFVVAQTSTFTNPVFNADFPDPDVMKAGDTYYAYATNSNNVNIQVARSSDLVTWKWLGEALPTLPSWAGQSFGNVWAPDVSQVGDGYLMYFVAHDAAHDTQCIGAATAAQPKGPFTPVGDQPLICQPDQGGSIDPASFVDDDGTRYVLWKNDGNSQGKPTWIYIQPVSDDGLTLTGEPTPLIRNDQPWEGAVVEAPTLWKQDGRYYLFYSANSYSGAAYAIGYAASDDLLGPYQKPKQPLLASIIRPGGIIGPGGQDIISVDGATWMFLHKWSATDGRDLNLVRLQWKDGVPFVEWSHDPQPAP